MTLSHPLPAAALLLAFAAEPPPVTEPQANERGAMATLRVEVGTLRNTSGKVGCRLVSKADRFPEGPGVELRVTPVAPKTTCVFENVAPGTYAISVMHDENGDGKLDKNFFGVPTEGYGVSNNQTHALSSPSWEDAKFTVGPGEVRTFSIELRY